MLQQEVTLRTAGFRLVFISRSTASSFLEELGNSYSTLWKIYLSAFMSFVSQWSFVIFNRFMYSFPSALSNNNTYKAIKGKNTEQRTTPCTITPGWVNVCVYLCVVCVGEGLFIALSCTELNNLSTVYMQMYPSFR